MQRVHTYNTTSPTRRTHQHLYDWDWRRYSKRRLAQFPHCVDCLKEGKQRRGHVTDHIIDHDGDPVLFRDPDNHQTLCTTHHNRKTRREHGLPPLAQNLRGVHDPLRSTTQRRRGFRP